MSLTNKEVSGLVNLVLFSVISMVVVGYIALAVNNKTRADNGMKPQTMMQFLDLVNPSVKSILVGMGSGVVFGFIDNAGLWFGMDALDPVLPGGELTKAGFGNTYSDFLGSFLATFIGNIIANKTGVEGTPIWSESVGVVAGCLLGIYVPSMITGKS